MNVYYKSFLDDLAKLLRAYNVRNICAVMDKIIIDFEDENSMQFLSYNGEREIFGEVMTRTDYKADIAELDTEKISKNIYGE